MSLRQTSRSVDDLLYSLGNALQKFKGENGLRRMLDAGKLSWLSFVGEFQETRDELFDRRSESLSETRKSLVALNDLFDDVTRYAKKMVQKLDQITATLDKFHRVCDLELDDPEDTENDGYIIAEEKLKGMGSLNAELKKVLDDFCSSADTCKTLNVSTVSQLQEVDTETAGKVGKSQTDFDTQRRRVQVKEDEVKRLRGMGTGVSPDYVQFAEFNLQHEADALQRAGDSYFITVREAIETTSFALEQTCMATWASSNVFFVQYGTFLREVESRVKDSAKLLIDIKNCQKVSKQIGEERKAMFEALYPNGTAPPPRAAEAPQSTDGDLENLFGTAISRSQVPPPAAAAAAVSMPAMQQSGDEEGGFRSDVQCPQNNIEWGAPAMPTTTLSSQHSSPQHMGPYPSSTGPISSASHGGGAATMGATVMAPPQAVRQSPAQGTSGHAQMQSQHQGAGTRLDIDDLFS